MLSPYAERSDALTVVSPLWQARGVAAENTVADAALARALEEVRELKARLEALQGTSHETWGQAMEFADLVGRTPPMARLISQIDQVAGTDATVLVTGETGTGKELVARAVHRKSRRRDNPLVIVNCAALSPTLVESELFGHEKGAFTGATSRRIGRFEFAHRGTVFLDEIGELPEEIQLKLLRVLQSGEFERIGSTQTIRVNVRLITATNRDLERAVEQGRMRSDLFYRLHVFPIHVPPLREREADIPLLVAYLTEKKGKAIGKIIRHVPGSVMHQLMQYRWPGNVRELENVIERAVILSNGGVLSLDGILGFGAPSSGSATDRPAVPADERGRQRRTLREVEHDYILRVCEDCGWRIKGPGSASVRLGLKPSTLYHRMKKLGIAKSA